jgi:N-acetylmuramoyl-L-alanine amidase
MKIGSTRAIANGKFLTMDTPPLLVDGTVMLPVRFVAEELGIEVKWDNNTKTVLLGRNNSRHSQSRNWSRTPVVVIDPGHGGKMSGAVHSGVKEKDLNLDIAKRLNTLLREQGIETYMTRNDDRHVDLYPRADLANRLNADLFVSIHNNAGSSSMSGSMTLYYPGGSGFTSKTFASIMQKELVNNLGTRNLGIIPRPNLAVLRRTKMPAVLVEVAFMTNSSDMKKLKTADFRQAAAESIRDGIIKALNSK